MKIKIKKRDIPFILFALFFLGAAVFHTIGAFTPSLRPDTAQNRHIIFIFINALSFYFVLRRPFLAIPYFALLTLQQIYSHGSHLLGVWQEQNQIDWIDVGVIILLPLIFVLVTRDVLKRRRREQEDGA